MHKGILLLVKADDRSEAESKAEAFLEPYGDGDVWDWYQFGGRWTGILTGYDPYKDERNLETCYLCQGTGDRKDLESPDWKKQCNGCNGCNGTGKMVKGDLVKVDDDMLSLTDERAASKVREWAKDWEKIQLERIDKAKAGFPDDKSMQGYFLKRQGAVIGDDFCFETNVYDTEEGTNKLPESFEGYWVVVCDLHN